MQTRRKLIYRMLGALTICAFAYVAYDYLYIDSCFDAGGVWRWSGTTCEGARPGEY